MFCPYCGNKNENDAVFCAYCGKKIQDIEVMESGTDDFKEENEFWDDSDQSKKTKGKSKIGNILVACMVALVVIVAGIENFGSISKKLNVDEVPIVSETVDKLSGPLDMTYEEAIDNANLLSLGARFIANDKDIFLDENIYTTHFMKNRIDDGEVQAPIYEGSIKQVFEYSPNIMIVNDKGTVYENGKIIFPNKKIQYLTLDLDQWAYIGIDSYGEAYSCKINQDEEKKLPFDGKIKMYKDLENGYALFVMQDGTVIQERSFDERELTDFEENQDKYNYGEYHEPVIYDLSNWKDIVLIDTYNTDYARSALAFIVGMKADGTLIGAGNYPKEIDNWEDIVYFSCDKCTVCGLTSDGHVKVAYANEDLSSGQMEFKSIADSLEDVTAIKIIAYNETSSLLYEYITVNKDGTFTSNVHLKFLNAIHQDGTIEYAKTDKYEAKIPMIEQK